LIDSLDYHWLFWLPLVAVAAATVATLASIAVPKRSDAALALAAASGER
jgi:hypothetical protein